MSAPYVNFRVLLSLLILKLLLLWLCEAKNNIRTIDLKLETCRNVIVFWLINTIQIGFLLLSIKVQQHKCIFAA